MFDSRAGPGGGFSTPLAGLEFLSFRTGFFCFAPGMTFFWHFELRPACEFVVTLGEFLFSDGHIQNIPLFYIFIRECTQRNTALLPA